MLKSSTNFEGAKEKSLMPEEWVNSIIIKAAHDRASDIHLDPFESKFQVRFRIDGVLVPITEQLSENYEMVVRRIKVLGQMNINEVRKPQDGRGSLLDPASQKMLEFRISSIPSIFGDALVIRFIDQSRVIFESFEAMGMESQDAEMLRYMISRPSGMILIAGPAGSGKTSTLYTALNHIRSPQKNIVTLEDPVEFHLENIRHCQIRAELGFTFAEGMKAVLRQDPDVIFIGEIRDHETAEIAIRAALSGRFVFSNISTSDTVGTLTRFLELGVPRSFLASSLLLAASKRLLRKNCLQCSVPYSPSPKFLAEAGITSLEGVNFKKGQGCEVCGNNGYFERVPIFEFLVIDKEIANMITEGATTREILDVAKKNGMKTLRESAVNLAVKGEITLEDAVYIT